MNERLENIPSPLRNGLALLAVGGVGRAIYKKIGRSRQAQPEVRIINGLTFNENQFERAVTAMVPFVGEWGLPLNPENLELMAYAALKHVSNPNPLTSAEDFAQIEDDVQAMIKDDHERHQRMLEAQQRDIDSRR